MFKHSFMNILHCVPIQTLTFHNIDIGIRCLPHHPSAIMSIFECIYLVLNFSLMNFVPKWMPFEEFADQPFNQMHEPFKYMIELCLAKVENGYDGFSPRPVSSYFVEELNCLYLNSHDLDNTS